jgi:hypothetical protein
MFISEKSQEVEIEDWGKDKLEKLLIQNQVKDKNKVVNCYENMINIVNHNYPHLKEEFNQVLRETLSIALSGIVIDNSLVISPLSWFSNKYSSDDLLGICNELSSQLFDIQEGYLSNKKQSQNREGIEF